MKRLLPAFLIILFSGPCFAQKTSTAQTLRLAQATYESGRLHEVEGYLRDFKSNVKQEQVAAYKLLCLTFIYLEEPKKADEQMLKILQTDNYFRPSDADPAEFVALWKTFRTQPIYRLGGKIGANASQPNVKSSVKANEGNSKFKYKLGFHAYITSEIPLTKKITLNPSIGFIQNSFEYNNKFTDGDTTLTTIVKETQQWISLPITVQYKVTNLKIEPYISLGLQVDYLLNAKSLASRERTGYQFIQEQTFDFNPLRKKMNLSAIAGAGARFRLGGGYFTGEISFTYGLTSLAGKSSAFGDNDMAFRYSYADNIFCMNALSLSAGYVYNIFNPKKISR